MSYSCLTPATHCYSAFVPARDASRFRNVENIRIPKKGDEITTSGPEHSFYVVTTEPRNALRESIMVTESCLDNSSASVERAGEADL